MLSDRRNLGCSRGRIVVPINTSIPARREVSLLLHLFFDSSTRPGPTASIGSLTSEKLQKIFFDRPRDQIRVFLVPHFAIFLYLRPVCSGNENATDAMGQITLFGEEQGAEKKHTTASGDGTNLWKGTCHKRLVS